MISSQTAKIKWQCRRGMLELDLILQRFISAYLNQLTAQQLATFELLLDAVDPELYSWLMGSSYPVNKELLEIVELIQLHSQLR